MSNSELLSETHTRDGGGRHIFNKEAQVFEKKLSSAIPEVLTQLKETYSDWDFEHHNTIYKKEWHEWDDQYPQDFGTYYEINKPYFKPDGGIITATKNDKSYIIYVGEAKKQGTNDIRALEGKPKQSKGNAIERSYKNIQEVRMLMHMQGGGYLPYVLFCHGCDFEPGSSILDRATALTWNSPFNRIYCENVSGFERASVFVSPEGFTREEMVDISFEMCERSLAWITSNIN
jgi:type II restriction enzyme